VAQFTRVSRIARRLAGDAATKALLVAALLTWSSETTSAAAPAGDRHGAQCPDHHVKEGAKAYGARARRYCEVRWRSQLAQGQTGGETHDEVIDTCLRRCVAGQAGAPLGWILGGVGAAALAGAAVGASGGHSTPPASP
jgi:hypothetical protein